MKRSVAILKSNLHHLGGLEKYTLRLANQFLKAGYHVTLISTGIEAKDYPDFEVISFKTPAGMSAWKVLDFDLKCKRLLSSRPFDLVFGLDRNRFQTHLRAGNGVHQAYLKTRMLQESTLKGLRHRINPLHRLLIHLEKVAFEHPDLRTLFTNSHMVKQEVLNFYKVDPQKIQVIHNGVEWQEMEKDFQEWNLHRKELLDAHHLNSHRFQFLFVGHNYQRKGLAPLLKGLALLKQKEWDLSVVGHERHVSYFQKLAKDLNIQDNIHFFGQLSRIRPFYQMADALVIPSFYDPFANVTLEALAMGNFVVSSKTNGGHEILTSQNGTVIEQLDSPESVSQALEAAMKFPKTVQRSHDIRQSVSHLDFTCQLNQYVQACFS